MDEFCFIFAIENFSHEQINSQNVIYSPLFPQNEFLATESNSSSQWYLSVHPKNQNKNYERFVGINLSMIKGSPKIVKFIIRLLDDNADFIAGTYLSSPGEQGTYFDEMNSRGFHLAYKWSEFTENEQILGRNDALRIHCTVKILSEMSTWNR